MANSADTNKAHHIYPTIPVGEKVTCTYWCPYDVCYYGSIPGKCCDAIIEYTAICNMLGINKVFHELAAGAAYSEDFINREGGNSSTVTETELPPT